MKHVAPLTDVDTAADAAPAAPQRIAVRQATRSFVAGRRAKVDALGPLDLSIGDAEFLCVVGPSGCGKSTLLKIIAGLLAPSSGEVAIEVSGDSRIPIAMVFQDYGIYPWKTVRANVDLGLRLSGRPIAERREIVNDWLGRLGLTDFADAYPGALSGGMRQRVSIARALAIDPEVLLMDEPFAALDAQLREVLQDELLAIWQARRRTVVFVTHSLEEALLLGDRVVVMSARPGRIIADITVPFERPRSGAVRTDPLFAKLRGDLWASLHSEVVAQFDTGRQK
ncbi:ABC transporter ATP-binding protein [Phytohabitans kaempferiae]|uniref:ABC transporter ATP-binding protein n=1 Tax=Phytohabitans kaempferiae TaxID=1620943 RepID=A0ABV6LY05_9ACTN